jgi:ribonuclease-3
MIGLAEFQSQIGITFHSLELLEQSLTHPSHLNEHPAQDKHDNERLEFLGDAILDFLSGEWLYHKFPSASEGYLTRLRAALVRTERLAGFAEYCSIGSALLLGKGEEESGGRGRPGNLCAAYEAFVGALYLDQGMPAARTFVEPHFDTAITEILDLELDKDPKSLLQEWSQSNLNATPSYQTIKAEGPDHAKEFTVAVFINGQLRGEGIGSNKQAAAQKAAQQALESLTGG